MTIPSTHAKEKFLELKTYLEALDRKKDEYLFAFIKKNWPQEVKPNHLTMARIGIGFILFILLLDFKNNNGIVIFPLFLLGVLTVLFDGAVAHCLEEKTHFGAIVDPIADRILLLPMFIYTILDYRLLLISIIFSEIVNAFISLIAYDRHVVFGPNIFAKTKMALQSVVLVAMLALWPLMPNNVFILILWISVACMAVSIMIKMIQLQAQYAAKEYKRI